MRIIIAPAKQMKEDTDTLPCTELPVFIDKAEQLKNYVNSLSYDEQKKLWACSDKIADGIQYTYMAPDVFEQRYFDYVQEHVRILSGFYGSVRPLDGVVPYRLEMQAKANVDGCKNLYEFWGDSLYREVLPEGRVIVNLASKEYSKCVEKYLQPQDRFITVVFGELQNGKVVQKGVYAKMARGEMVRFAAEINAESPEELKAFDRGYRFDEERSTETEYVFIR